MHVLRHKKIAGVTVSVVIPALNEAEHIGQTIGSVHEHLVAIADYEVIVADHGSSDGTSDIAASLGATVLARPLAPTIAALRNEAAAAARGGILLFLDADVTLTGQWAQYFPAVVRQVLQTPPMLIGSLCEPPTDAGWLERHWFGNPRTATHVGTGHLIVNRAYFQSLGGFRKDLRTGEDYEFSERARRRGGAVIIEPRLRVIHRGFPKSLRALVRREAWHGRGDLEAVSRYMRSKVALAASAFLFFHLTMVAGLLVQKVLPVLGGAIGIAAVLILSSMVRYAGAPPGSIVINSLIFYFYYLGRCLSLTYLFRSRPGGSPRHFEPDRR